MTTPFKTWLSLTMISFSFQQAINWMERCLFGTLLMDILSRPFRWLPRSSQMELHRLLGVDLSRTLSWETPLTISLLLQAPKSWLFGHWIQCRDLARMSWCRLEPWWEITLVLLSRSQTRSFCLQELNLEISVRSKLKTKCLFFLNLFVPRVLKIFKQ